MENRQIPPEYDSIRLSTKPSAEIRYTFTPATASPKTDPSLIVFINGLGLPQAGWTPAITKLRETSKDGLPAILTYDRFGQGQTNDRDPNDKDAADPRHAHDCISAVGDMRQLITQILNEKLGIDKTDDARLLMVGNSIGCSLVRLYAQEHPGTVSGILFLDSTLTDSDFVSILPDPDAKDTTLELPTGVTLDDLRNAREQIRKRFHPDVGNQEGLSRRNLLQLLPHADSPPLHTPDQPGPYITVLGHDFDVFANRTEMDMGVPAVLTQKYVNPYWDRYNQGLSTLTSTERSKGPLQVSGAGHFIQMDNPDVVVEKIDEILQSLRGSV
ncbi:hypothetical protein FZEAL_5019 [Fusarium zealandicum]|uniref:AB hydrolase-1 domain-containing protein n=1 Tax=Fusarium zealandicum TaxID=1053134 RepID=A0A8H4ULB8_9HYPO|nr:hypothetical protein FZEAL_5019 [Fusarium zealandicum]